MNISPFLYAVEVVGFASMGALALTRRRTRLEVSFFAFSVSLAVWQLFQLLAILCAGYALLASLLLTVSVASSAYMASLLFVFIAVYSKNSTPYWLFIPASLFALLAFFSEGIRATPITSAGIGIPQLDIFYAGLLAFDFTVLVASVVVLVINYRRNKSRQTREQMQVMMLGVAVTGFVAVLASFNSSDFSNTTYAQHVIPIACLIAVGSLFYAIMYKGLIDVKRASVRTATYILSLATLAAVYFGLAFIASSLFFKSDLSTGISVSPVNMALAVTLSFFFQPIKNFFDKITNRIFFRDEYSVDDFIVSLSETLRSTTDLRVLLEKAAVNIGKTLKSEQTFFYIPYGARRHITAGTTRHTSIPHQDIRSITSWMQTSQYRPIIVDALEEHSAMHRLLSSHKVVVVFPLRLMHDTTGFLFLGEHMNSSFTSRDIKLLRTISDELVIAIQNSLSVQEVKDINASLEQRIEAATAELRTSNARLKRIDASKDEFISMASHQLRTPLTSIKGYLSMVLEGDTGKITADQQHLLQEAFSSSERMVHLIHDFLNVSRLQNGKFMLEQHPYDLVSLVQSETNSLQRSAESRGLKLACKTSLKGLTLMIDETKFRQVVMNFIDNALYYSRPKGTITVKIDKVGDNVEVRVVDNGIGVPKAEQEHLFTKFFRAANARKQRPDGTGVGIFLAKKVVNEHGGTIIFESVEGKGSTFGFILPVSKLRPK